MAFSDLSMMSDQSSVCIESIYSGTATALPRERHTALDGRSATLFTSNRNPRRARRRQRRYVTFYSGRKVIFNTEERNQTMHVSTNGSENHNSPLTMLFRSIRSIPLQKNWFHLLCTYSILVLNRGGKTTCLYDFCYLPLRHRGCSIPDNMVSVGRLW